MFLNMTEEEDLSGNVKDNGVDLETAIGRSSQAWRAIRKKDNAKHKRQLWLSG